MRPRSINGGVGAALWMEHDRSYENLPSIPPFPRPETESDPQRQRASLPAFGNTQNVWQAIGAKHETFQALRVNL